MITLDNILSQGREKIYEKKIVYGAFVCFSVDYYYDNIYG